MSLMRFSAPIPRSDQRIIKRKRHASLLLPPILLLEYRFCSCRSRRICMFQKSILSRKGRSQDCLLRGTAAARKRQNAQATDPATYSFLLKQLHFPHKSFTRTCFLPFKQQGPLLASLAQCKIYLPTRIDQLRMCLASAKRYRKISEPLKSMRRARQIKCLKLF